MTERKYVANLTPEQEDSTFDYLIAAGDPLPDVTEVLWARKMERLGFVIVPTAAAAFAHLSELNKETAAPEPKVTTTTHEAAETPVGKLLLGAGFHIQHTGGNCLAWEKCTKTHYAWITDTDNGLGTERTGEPGDTSPWFVGIYVEAGNFVEADAPNLSAAIKWCDEMLATPPKELAL